MSECPAKQRRRRPHLSPNPRVIRFGRTISSSTHRRLGGPLSARQQERRLLTGPTQYPEIVRADVEPTIDRSIPLLVTGSGGFLGSHLRRELAQSGYTNLLLPRSRDYDFRHEVDVRRMFENLRPARVVHLAAVVGGIGANRERP